MNYVSLLVDVNICEHPNFLRTLYFIKSLLTLIKIVVPLMLMLFGMIVFFKSIFNSNTDINEVFKKFGNKIILSVAIYLLPTLVTVIMNATSQNSTTSCWNNANISKINLYEAKYEEAKLVEEQELKELMDKKLKEARTIATSPEFVTCTECSYLANEMLRVAYSELGYKEKDSASNLYDKEANAGSNDYTKYGVAYSKGYHSAWCAVFVWWVTANTYDTDGKSLYEKYVPVKSSWAKAYLGDFRERTDHRKWYNSQAYGGTYVPKRGDIITFNKNTWNKITVTASHVGIVDTVSRGKVYTIEGNSGDSVAKREHLLNSKYIMGYAVWE